MAAIVDRSKGISYQELIAQDPVPPPTTLKLENPYQPGVTTRVPVSRYATKEFHDLEMEKLWPRVWQMACREEEIPEVGNYTIYEIGSYSIVVVRTAEGIKAHHNVCRHRGRRLCDHPGHASSFICPFHGFSWNIDGSLRSVTSEWDFPHIDKEELTLTPVRCETWGGWVFINMDMNAEPLVDFLGDLPAHFAVWEPENRYIEAHVAKIMSCNWKACQEAFMEAFHVINTHPQILVGIGDENTQYDAWGNFSRAITPNGTPSPHLRFEPEEQELFDSVTMRFMDRPSLGEVPEGMTARAMIAAGARPAMEAIVGEGKDLSDASLSDSIYYTLFPNFHPWGGYNRIVYRFRPYKNHHDKSIMECYYLSPFSGERPDPAPVHWLGEDEDWTEATELGILAKVFQQDTFNLPKVQIGLEAAQYEEIVLASYQESKIRHFHSLLQRWIEK
ncbi:MAG: Rieske 2Fe-2S domain-containing protein [Pseudomonadales bacterium]|nr:aromatic ring-hydroxylating dioxygenase subunit alpha [Pseudomonadales bacterium]NIX09929.1 Rieske 2Fe-2S domain-containing protein [Pseudomonadales bacterium]